jgi:hypothetical protein
MGWGRAKRKRERERRRDRTRDGERVRARDAEVGLETLPPLPLSLSLSLSAQKTDTGGSRLFHSPFSFTYCPPGRGTSLGGEMLAGCGKDGKQEKGKERGRERE